MTSPNRIFRTRSLEFEKESEKPAQRPEFKRESHELQDRNLEFSTLTEGGEHIACSARTHQSLRMLGYDNTRIRDTLHTVDVLKNLAERPVDTVVFASIRERNSLGLGAMASIAAVCNLKAADAGVTLRSAARFYARRKSNVDVDDLERFVKWMVDKGNKGEPITGMPSEWEEYCRLTNRQAVKRRYRGFRSAARRRSASPARKYAGFKASKGRFLRSR
jgi:hypothetical protein